ncbi:MAG: hypothetical protein PF443_02385, partial [Allgaiera sp.]|nr:hypothetical protein [Allgaiera sp.]
PPAWRPRPPPPPRPPHPALGAVGPLPGDLAEEDYVVFHGMGAYSAATNTRFNGFGDLGLVTTLSLHS